MSDTHLPLPVILIRRSALGPVPPSPVCGGDWPADQHTAKQLAEMSRPRSYEVHAQDGPAIDDLKETMESLIGMAYGIDAARAEREGFGLLLIPVPYNSRLLGCEFTNGAQCSLVVCLLPQDSAADEHYLDLCETALNNDPLARALAVKRISEAAEASGNPVPMLSPRVLHAATAEAKLLQESHKTHAGRAAGGRKRQAGAIEERGELLKTLTPLFKAAMSELAQRKKTGAELLAKKANSLVNNKSEFAAMKKYSSYLTEHYAGQWLKQQGNN